MSTPKKRGLGGGRGLDVLLGAVRQVREEIAAVEVNPAAPAVTSALQSLPIEQLQRGRYQPRRDMNPAALQELSDSIKAQGVMQPIIVRAVGPKQYEIIAGERRWRAAQMAGLDTIPAIVRDIPDEAAIAWALIENIQREDLNPMEQAAAMQRFADEFEMTHQQIAEAVGKARATVSNLLRLTQLPREVKTLLEHGDLEMGHARALLSLPDAQQTEIGRLVVAKGLSVRQTETLVRSLITAKEKTPSSSKREDPNVAQLQQSLADRIGAGVKIEYNKKGQGKLIISYNSFEELDGILAHIQ